MLFLLPLLLACGSPTSVEAPSAGSPSAGSPPAGSPAPRARPGAPAASGAPQPGATFTPTQGRGQPPADTRGDEADVTGPWNLRLKLARSTDGGRSFTPTGEVLADQGGVPSLLAHDGQLFAWYIAWQDGQNFTAVASRKLSGGTWTYRRVALTGDASRAPNLADPHVVALGDGRLRMYWQTMQQGKMVVLSATSRDGVRWTQESGVRYAPGDGLESPAVLEVPGGWLLVAGPLGRHVAFSSDGLSFQDRAALGLGKAFMPYSSVTLKDGRVRMFASDGKGVARSAVSRDGKRWEREERSWWPGGDGFDGNGDSAVAAAGDDLLLVYTERIR